MKNTCSFCKETKELIKLKHPRKHWIYNLICQRCLRDLKQVYPKVPYYQINRLAYKKFKKDSKKEKKWYNPK